MKIYDSQNVFLITGGRGFIAKNLSSFLEHRGHLVYHLNRIIDSGTKKYVIYRNEKLIESVSNFSNLSKFKISCIYHLASKYRSRYNEHQYEELKEASFNLTYQLANIAENFEIPIVIPGSYVQDLDLSDLIELKKYADVKNEAEKVILEFNKLRVATTRQFESYGFFDTRKKILNNLVDNALSNKKIIYFDLNLEVDFINVYDLCSAYYSIFKDLDKTSGPYKKNYLVSSGISIKLFDIVKILEQLLDKPVKMSDPIACSRNLSTSKQTLKLTIPPNWSPVHKLHDEFIYFVNNRRQMLEATQR